MQVVGKLIDTGGADFSNTGSSQLTGIYRGEAYWKKVFRPAGLKGYKKVPLGGGNIFHFVLRNPQESLHHPGIKLL
ncbi:MAG: hypothetical protein H0Z39_06395, partial [Peptococcaceae bacterium]|nr:hypothetical protein [Peptococcaceae bacterium]